MRSLTVRIVLAFVAFVAFVSASARALPPVQTVDVGAAEVHARLAKRFAVPALAPLPILIAADVGPLTFPTVDAGLLCHLVGHKGAGATTAAPRGAAPTRIDEAYVLAIGHLAEQNGKQVVGPLALVAGQSQRADDVVAFLDLPVDVAARFSKRGDVYRRAALLRVRLPTPATVQTLASVRCEP